MSNSPAAEAAPSRSGIAAEAARRRTFAIISHPDAGKTTLTEHLLLAGGAIRAAGAVRARGENRRTRSDWMKIERERGISVSASVMTFDHDGLMFNLLDTPGHEDFSEDTYRTLTAADAAVMVLDAAKGIEPQTLKLFEVCRLRDIPIVTFINKMDREALDPIELLDEIASKLALDPAPLYWPAGSGSRFRGMVDMRDQRFLPYTRKTADGPEGHPAPVALNSNAVVQFLDPEELAEAQEGAELIAGASKPFDPQAFLEGHMTPVLFGSALRHFGVEELLAALGAFAPPPKLMPALKGGVETHVAPGQAEVSGFVFKVQANMDPNHRDRIAMLRLTSGKFQRGMKLKVQNTGRQLSVNAPIMFFASERELAEEAYAGDVIGIPNHGVLRVGDSLSESGTLRFAGLPNFAPEILRRVRVKDPLKAKHLKKALEGPGRGGGDPAVPADPGRGLHRRRRGPAAVRGDAGPAGRRIRPGRDLRGRPLRRGPLAGRRQGRHRGLHLQAPHLHRRGHRRPARLPGQVGVGHQLCGGAVSEGGLQPDEGAGVGGGL